MICNDRRWPEAWRILGLQSVELITADLDLDRCTLGRTTTFAFDKHRRPKASGRITGQVRAVNPPVWSEANEW